MPLVILFLLLHAWSESLAETSSPAPRPKAARVRKKPANSITPTTVKTIEEPVPVVQGVRVDPFTVHHWFKYNTRMGVAFGGGSPSGFTIGAQFGYAPFYPRALYFGPSFDFLLFDQGSGILALGAVWHEFGLGKTGDSRLMLGLGGGGAFMARVPNVNPTEVCGLGEIGILYPINELAGLKMQGRAGFLGDRFLSIVTFNVEFRFI